MILTNSILANYEYKGYNGHTCALLAENDCRKDCTYYKKLSHCYKNTFRPRPVSVCVGRYGEDTGKYIVYKYMLLYNIFLVLLAHSTQRSIGMAIEWPL